MAEKREHSPSHEPHSCSARFVYPVSFVSLLICTTALVRVEIINQRVRTVEDLVAEIKQTPNVGLVRDAVSFKQAERVKSVGEFDDKDTEEGQVDATEGERFIF